MFPRTIGTGGRMKQALLRILRGCTPATQARVRLWACNLRLLARLPSREPLLRVRREQDGAWLLRKGTDQIFIAVPDRIGLYLNGIERRLRVIQDVFLVSSLGIRSGDRVIDIGANVGEFSLPLLRSGARVDLFEMDPNVLTALDRNVAPYRGARVHSIGLWNETCVKAVFLKSDTADTSLVYNGATASVEVSCRALDEIESIEAIDTIRLLKCDAEGAEPEVLSGARKTLERTRFVAVDCGPERGAMGENTSDAVECILLEAGFVVRERAHGIRAVLLAENKAFPG